MEKPKVIGSFKKHKRTNLWNWSFKYIEDETIFKWSFDGCSMEPNEIKVNEIAKALIAFAKKMLGKNKESSND